jgi:leucyl aminopeptidase (aminopeptidase T)
LLEEVKMSNSFKEILMIKGSSKIVNDLAGVKGGEQVLIVTDYDTLSIAQSLAIATVEAGAEPTLMIMRPREAHGLEPPDAVAVAMTKADVVFEPVSKSIAHTSSTKKAREAGARVIVLPEYTEDMMISGGLEADFLAQKSLCENMRDHLTNAQNAQVTTALGTDIAMSLEGRPGRALHGLAREKGGYSCPPNIEASIAPVEGTARGVIVADASISSIGLLSYPVTILVEDGLAKEIKGGDEARKLKEILESANDPKVYNIGELGVGLNPKAKLCGLMLEDEGALGSVHIALGSNADFGGQTRTARHIDLILSRATLKLDGKTVLKDGQVVI